MKRIRTALALSTLAILFTSGSVLAQHHDNDTHGYVHHSEWRKGARMNPNDWKRGQQIDYRRYHLNAPPRGYEWREVDGNYVLAAAATGLIASVIAASAAH